MNRYIVSLLISLVSVYSFSSKPYRPLNEFDKNVGGYLKYNFENRSEYYSGKSFECFYKDLEIEPFAYSRTLDEKSKEGKDYVKSVTLYIKSVGKYRPLFDDYVVVEFEDAFLSGNIDPIKKPFLSARWLKFYHYEFLKNKIIKSIRSSPYTEEDKKNYIDIDTIVNPVVYYPYSRFYGDVRSYLKYNFEKRSYIYSGKTFENLMKDLELTPLSYGPMMKCCNPHVCFAIELYFKNIGKENSPLFDDYLVVYWKTDIIAEDIWKLSDLCPNYKWTDASSNFFKDKIVYKIVYNPYSY